jgi:hypothetical protein
MMEEAIQVECYSGSRYAERPLSFALDGEPYIIKAIEESWRSPSALHFRVRTENGESFELAYDEELDQWRIWKLSHAQEEQT